MVAGRGGRLGPNFTQIGAVRSKAFLIREIRNPDEYVPKGFDSISVVTTTGEKITGVRKNYDLFSLQMMDERENVRSFLRDELREVVVNDGSLMPAYGTSELADAELDDILRYLASLR